MVEDGDVDKALSEAVKVYAGRVGGQEHFYLETQACLVIPKGEQGEVEILSSTLGTSNVQTWCLNIDLLCSLVFNTKMHPKLSTTLPNYHVVGKVCRTSLPSNTAFHGLGALFRQ